MVANLLALPRSVTPHDIPAPVDIRIPLDSSSKFIQTYLKELVLIGREHYIFLPEAVQEECYALAVFLDNDIARRIIRDNLRYSYNPLMILRVAGRFRQDESRLLPLFFSRLTDSLDSASPRSILLLIATRNALTLDAVSIAGGLPHEYLVEFGLRTFFRAMVSEERADQDNNWAWVKGSKAVKGFIDAVQGKEGQSTLDPGASTVVERSGERLQTFHDDPLMDVELVSKDDVIFRCSSHQLR